MSEHTWSPLKTHDDTRWCRDCGCLSALAADGKRFYFPVSGARVDVEPGCMPVREYVDVIRDLLTFGEHAPEYGQVVARARRLLK